jgi:Flp pilus assembly protein TadD
MIYLRRGERPEAVAQFRRATELHPAGPGPRNGIAWDLATNHNPKLRDGTIAVEFATKECELTGWKNSTYLDTLAAAYAESGNFEAAVTWQTKAIEIQPNGKDKEDFRKRLKLFQAKKPFHRASPPY